jgi:hypothetical protein
MNRQSPRSGGSRRRLLAALGAGLAGGGVAATLLPDATESPAVAATAGPVDEQAEPIAEEATPYAVWQYEPVDSAFRATSPINVVSPLADGSFDALFDVFRGAGWYEHPAEYVRYARDRAAGEYRPPDYAAAETQFGVAGRLHVRCWHLDGTASIQAHVDTPATPKHGISSYAAGRAAVERRCRDAGWRIADSRLEFGNDSRPDHDGLASVIRR